MVNISEIDSIEDAAAELEAEMELEKEKIDNSMVKFVSLAKVVEQKIATPPTARTLKHPMILYKRKLREQRATLRRSIEVELPAMMAASSLESPIKVIQRKRRRTSVPTDQLTTMFSRAEISDKF